ncbi:MAG: hypothetical protein ACXVBO_15880 [Isosphaeraceae bacterium]
MNRPKVEANCCRNSERASELAGHADIRTTEVYFVRKEEDAEVAARRIHICLTGRTGK